MSGPEAWVLNCHYNGLSLIQDLGRQGVRMRAVDSARGIGTFSRYAKYSKVPDPGADERGFINALWRFRKETDQSPVLLPTNDHWAAAIANHKEELSEAFLCCVADEAVVSLLLDKERFGRWGASLSLPVPVPQIWSVDEARAELGSLPYPVAVKANARRKVGQGEYSRAWTRAADRLRFRACGASHELNVVLEEAEAADVPVFVQQVIRGRSDAMHSIGVYARDGEVLGIIYGKKLRGFPPAFGDCVVGIASPVPDWALQMATTVCGDLKYTGLAEFEVMVDAVSGMSYLIEINPRSWSWVGVAAPAGVDLAGIAHRNLVFGERPQSLQMGCADGQFVYYAKALADLQNTLLWYRFTDAKDWVYSPSQWRASYRGYQGVFAEFAKDDPLVGVVSMLHSAKQFAGRAVRVIRGREF